MTIPKGLGVGDHRALEKMAGQPVAIGTIVDDDNAATTGTAINVVANADGFFATLESNMAGAADIADVEIGASGPTAKIIHNATPGGVALFFDEDALARDSRLMAVLPDARDAFVVLSNGKCLRVVHNSDAATDGVALHVDDDAANAHQKLLFVSPTNANGTIATDDDVTLAT